jgi:hypothetical protein
MGGVHDAGYTSHRFMLRRIYLSIGSTMQALLHQVSFTRSYC